MLWNNRWHDAYFRSQPDSGMLYLLRPNWFSWHAIFEARS